MRSSVFAALTCAALVSAVFKDEVGDIDFHHQLLGVPQVHTTFFHRPRLDDKATLLYTLSDLGIVGAVNPGNGAVQWRQELSVNATAGSGFLRAGHGESWVVSALGRSVQAWQASNGRNIWTAEFDGEVRDVEIMELTENGRKDVLALFDTADGTILRRINGNEGTVVWEFKEVTKDIALQVSNNIEKVFVVSLQGSSGSYTIKSTTLDTLTGKRVDEQQIGARNDISKESDIMFVGANSAAPIVAWTDPTLSKIKIHVLGTKQKQEFPLPEGTTSVEIHAPHQLQSQPHFLVHSRTAAANKADVYHVDLRSSAITKAYELPLLKGKGAFSTSSSGANVYFTRAADDQITLTDSTSAGILGRWQVKVVAPEVGAVGAVSEVLKKPDNTYALRTAVLTGSADWVLVRNAEIAWTRTEGLSGAVAAAFADIPESAQKVQALEQEAHSNPISAYIHRVNRHVNELQHLPAWLMAVPQRLIGSILGTDAVVPDTLTRDSFGFHRIVVLATRRGWVYGLDFANHGAIIWSRKAVDLLPGETWDVKGIFVDELKQQVTIRGADGEFIVLKPNTGAKIEEVAKGRWPAVEHAVVVNSQQGPWLLPVGKNGKIDDFPLAWMPQQNIVVRGEGESIRGLKFVPKRNKATTVPTWEFTLPAGQRIAHIASRSPHDQVASIGRVLGDRTVLYKYLNPNTIVLSATDDATKSLSVYLLDTVSGQVLASSTYDGVDTAQPVECVIAENWYLCSFFGQYKLRETQTQSLRGHQVVVSDLYESEQPNDRGPIGNAANHSALEPVETPTDVVLPFVVSQTFVLGASVSALAVSQTRQGIATRQVLAYVTSEHGIVGIPRMILEPRRVVGRDPTAAEMEEGLMRYAPGIDMDPKLFVSHERDIVGVRQILAAPAHVESTSLVLAFGVDVFGTRVTPSMTFDILGKGFGKLSLVGTVLALMGGVAVLGPLVRRKQINGRWTAPL